MINRIQLLSPCGQPAGNRGIIHKELHGSGDEIGSPNHRRSGGFVLFICKEEAGRSSGHCNYALNEKAAIHSACQHARRLATPFEPLHHVEVVEHFRAS
jgi:hypothetical protein